MLFVFCGSCFNLFFSLVILSLHLCIKQISRRESIESPYMKVILYHHFLGPQLTIWIWYVEFFVPAKTNAYQFVSFDSTDIVNMIFMNCWIFVFGLFDLMTWLLDCNWFISVGTCLVIWSSCIKTNNSFEAFDNVILHIVKPNGCFTHLVQGDWSKKCKEALSKFELLKEGKSKDDIVYDKAVQVANYIGYQIESLSIYVPNNSYS